MTWQKTMIIAVPLWGIMLLMAAGLYRIETLMVTQQARLAEVQRAVRGQFERVAEAINETAPPNLPLTPEDRRLEKRQTLFHKAEAR